MAKFIKSNIKFLFLLADNWRKTAKLSTVVL